MNGEMSNMVPFNRALGNRNVAGDFHRPYESVPFNAPLGNRNVAGDFHRPRSTVGADMGGKLGGGMKIFYNKNRRPSTEGGLFYNSSNFNEKCRMVW